MHIFICIVVCENIADIEGNPTTFSQLVDNFIQSGLQLEHRPPDHANTCVSGNAGLRPVFDVRTGAEGRKVLERQHYNNKHIQINVSTVLMALQWGRNNQLRPVFIMKRRTMKVSAKLLVQSDVNH